MKQVYKDVIDLLQNKDYGKLNDYKIQRPDKMNWMVEIFEGIHLKNHPNKTALLWTNGEDTINYSFQDIATKTNKLLNFLRRKGINKGDVLFTQMMLQPITWTSILANIKGGFKMIPAASILGTQDIVYRFEKTFPKVVFADQDNAYKTDEAEKQLGKIGR